MFQREDLSTGEGGGGTSRALVLVPKPRTLIDRLFARFGDIDLAPDLGSRIGTLTWYRGAATCVGLCAFTLLLAPGFEAPIYGTVPPPLSGGEWDAARAQAIKPLGQGSISGYHVAATNLVAPLTDTPERPIIQNETRLSSGTALLAVLQRSGVGKTDAGQVGALVTKAMALNEIQPGTMLDLTLGRRLDKSQPRPLEKLEFRAKFDLKLEVARNGGALSLKQIPIAIDRTPLRIQGMVGSSLYRSARAAGAPAKAVEAYLRTVASRVSVSKIGSGCKFDIIVGQARAATGEVQMGSLMYAGVTGCGNSVQLVPWGDEGKTEWFDGAGRGNKTGMMGMPAAGHFSSGFGMRMHPILGYTRMHRGVDIAAPWGSPVYAAIDGVVQVAGRSAGYGNFIKLGHDGGYGTGYGHLSRILVRPGQHVRKGQQIGAIGNTGLSTGPHLHYELYKNGVAVNPRSVSFSVENRLTGGALGAFKAKLSTLLAVPIGHGAQRDED
ncbi:M23 family metallopeptidase [Sphingomonas sp. JC676]|nr:M23 family metallopeptidase [Sphingomonas sp. JC676]